MDTARVGACSACSAGRACAWRVSFEIGASRHRQVGASGHLISESHPRARLRRWHVDLILDLHEDAGVSLGVLARWFGVSKECVRDICNYRNWSSPCV